MSRLAIALISVLLGGCSCCNAPPGVETLTYVVDDATAARISGGRTGEGDADACRAECGVVAGRVDPGPVDANVPDAGAARPTLPQVNGCTIQSNGGSMLLTCYFAGRCDA